MMEEHFTVYPTGTISRKDQHMLNQVLAESGALDNSPNIMICGRLLDRGYHETCERVKPWDQEGICRRQWYRQFAKEARA